MAQSPHRRRVSLRIAVLLLFWGSSGTASTIRVPADYPSIQEGVDASSPGDTVLVGPGTYLENVTIGHGLVLVSEEGAASTTIDAQGQGTVMRILRVNVPGAVVTIEGFRITGGYSSLGEAGITFLNVNANGVVRNNIIDHNYSGAGNAALRIAGTFIIVEDNVIEDNLSGKGDIVSVWGTFRRNILRRNAGGQGLADLNGIAENNLIVENWDHPNGMVSASGIFRNNTVASNGWAGSAVVVGNAQEVSNNIITHPLGQGRGLYCGENVQSVRCNNVIGGGVSYVGECEGMEGTEGNISLDPQFCTLGQPDYRLMPSSPCAPENSPPGCGLIGALGVCGAAGLGDAELPSNRPQLLIDPNPITRVASFELEGGANEVVIDIIDAHGRIVDRLVMRSSRQFTWTPDREIANGVYFARVQTPHETSVAKFILVR
jgi:hypothetical protein